MTSPQLIVRPIAEEDLSEWFRLRRKLWDATSDDDHKAEMLDILDHVETQFVAVVEPAMESLRVFLRRASGHSSKIARATMSVTWKAGSSTRNIDDTDSDGHW